MAGKCRALARLRSSAQKQRMKRFVFRVTGSVKSPPGGETTPMIVMLNVHYTRVGDLERPDHIVTSVPVPIQGYRDSFGNWCSRLVAPAGPVTIGADSIILCEIDGQPVSVRQDGFSKAAPGDIVRLAWDACHEHQFDQASGRRLETAAGEARRMASG